MKHIMTKHFAILAGSILAACFLLFCLIVLHPGFSPRALALNAESTIGLSIPSHPTCATASAQQQVNLCDQADPIAQGCVADAKTLHSIGIVDNKGTFIGRIDLRVSKRCNSLWARMFDFRASRPKGTVLVLQVGRNIYTENDPHAIYTNMHYILVSGDTPLIQGSIDGKKDGTFSINSEGYALIPTP